MSKKITAENIQSHLQTLTKMPGKIAACTQGIDEERLKTQPAPKVWSVVEHIAHLRGGVEVWGYSIYAMILLDAPQLAFIHPRDWSKMQGYTRLTFAENFTAYQVERKNLLRKLNELKFDDWARICHFKGKKNIYTIYSQFERMSMHERDHFPQIEAAVRGA